MNEMLKEAVALPKILSKGIYRNNIVNENGLEVARLGLFAIVGDEDPAAEALRDAIIDRYNAADELLDVLQKAVRYGGLFPDLKAEAEAVIAKAKGE